MNNTSTQSDPIATPPPESVDVGLDDVDLARRILTQMGRAISPSREPGADPTVERIAALIAQSHTARPTVHPTMEAPAAAPATAGDAELIWRQQMNLLELHDLIRGLRPELDAPGGRDVDAAIQHSRIDRSLALIQEISDHLELAKQLRVARISVEEILHHLDLEIVGSTDRSGGTATSVQGAIDAGSSTPTQPGSKDGLQNGLVPCPSCGANTGYTLSKGSTFRWWDVACASCGHGAGDCRADVDLSIHAPIPDGLRTSNADAVWNEAGAHAEQLRAAVKQMRPWVMEPTTWPNRFKASGVQHVLDWVEIGRAHV